MKIRAKMMMALVAISLLGAGSVFGGIIVSLEEAGTDLVVRYSGSIDLTGLTTGVSAGVYSSMRANGLYLSLGPNSGEAMRTIGNQWSAPIMAIGTSSAVINADVVTGDNFRVTDAWLSLPGGYTSGTSIAGSMTFNNTSYATFGISSGLNMTGVLNNGDTVTIQAVPEPATAGLLGLSSLLIFAIRRMQKAYALR